MTPLKEIEWKNGVLWACAGQSSQIVTREYFMQRSGISNNKTMDKIERDWQITFKKLDK